MYFATAWSLRFVICARQDVTWGKAQHQWMAVEVHVPEAACSALAFIRGLGAFEADANSVTSIYKSPWHCLFLLDRLACADHHRGRGDGAVDIPNPVLRTTRYPQLSPLSKDGGIRRLHLPDTSGNFQSRNSRQLANVRLPKTGVGAGLKKAFVEGWPFFELELAGGS